MDVFGMTTAGAGAVLFVIPIGYIVGNVLFGFISDRFMSSRKRLILILLVLFLVPLFLLCAWFQPGRTHLLYPAFFALGVFASGMFLCLSHVKELFPKELAGTALALSNFCAIGGAAVLQYIMGLLIGRYPRVGLAYPLQAYRDSFYLLLAGMIFSLIIYYKVAKSDNFKAQTLP